MVRNVSTSILPVLGLRSCVIKVFPSSMNLAVAIRGPPKLPQSKLEGVLLSGVKVNLYSALTTCFDFRQNNVKINTNFLRQK